MNNRLKYLDGLARENNSMPVLNWHEQAYFISSRGLYQQFDDKKITVDQARKEKAAVIRAYEENEVVQEFVLRAYALREKLKRLREEEFNSVLEAEIMRDIDNMFK